MPNIIKFELYYNWSAQAVNNILERFLKSSKPIKFAHLQKLANQLTLNKANVIEIKVPWLFDVERNVSIEKKTEDGEDSFFKALVNRFWLTS